MTWGTCGSCNAKDSEIAYLRDLVESLRKENLGLVDLRAQAATFPRPARPARPAQEEPEVDPVHASPGQVRSTLYHPAQTYDKVEELFDLEQKFAEGNS